MHLRVDENPVCLSQPVYYPFGTVETDEVSVGLVACERRFWE